MNSHRKPDDDETLQALLREWSVDSPLPPRFKEQVWQRIVRAEAPSEFSFLPAFIRLLEAVLPRPKIAVSYVTALAILGVVAGSVAAQLRSTHLNAALSSRYVQSVDPYRAETAQP